jgi:hypothetical protein
MTELVDSILGYFSDKEDKQHAKPAKRTKQYRKKRPAVSVKATIPTAAQQRPGKSIARLSPKSRAYLLRRLGASPKPRNTIARTKKNLRALQEAMPAIGDGDMDGFPEKALSEGYHFNNDAVDREVLEPNEEMASGMRSDSTTGGYMTDSEDDAFGPEMKALAKQFSSVSTYSKFIKDGKKTEFGSYVLNNSDKPYIESGKIKNGKMVIKRQPRQHMMTMQ